MAGMLAGFSLACILTDFDSISILLVGISLVALYILGSNKIKLD